MPTENKTKHTHLCAGHYTCTLTQGTLCLVRYSTINYVTLSSSGLPSGPLAKVNLLSLTTLLQWNWKILYAQTPVFVCSLDVTNFSQHSMFFPLFIPSHFYFPSPTTSKPPLGEYFVCSLLHAVLGAICIHSRNLINNALSSMCVWQHAHKLKGIIIYYNQKKIWQNLDIGIQYQV